MLKKLYAILSNLGIGLLSKLKYEFDFKYDRYEFLKTSFIEEQAIKTKTLKNICKKLS